MSDLMAWLLEQIDADEGLARKASGPGWHLESWVTFPPRPGAVWSALPPRDENLVAAGGPNPQNLAHLANWDPARVLAECEVKRLLVEEFDSCGDLLKILALPYADQPGYDESWRP